MLRPETPAAATKIVSYASAELQAMGITPPQDGAQGETVYIFWGKPQAQAASSLQAWVEHGGCTVTVEGEIWRSTQWCPHHEKGPMVVFQPGGAP